MSHLPGKESAATGGAGGAAAAERAIHASARAHRTFGGTLLRVGVGAAAAYGLWHVWQHSEEPLPKPVTEAVRCWHHGGGCGARGSIKWAALQIVVASSAAQHCR